jgi:tetratricopeptide (TPR) repeat protein
MTLARITCLVVTLTGVAHAAASDRAGDYFRHGRARYQAGDYAGALRAFERSSEARPKPSLMVDIAQCLSRLGRLDEAARAYHAFLDSRSGGVRVRAEVLEALEDLDRRRHVSHAPTLPPAHTNVARDHFKRGRARYQAGRYDEALSEFRASYLAHPSPALLVNVGQCLRKLDRPEEAVAAYRTFLAARPKPGHARVEVHEALERVGKELDRRMYGLAESVAQFNAFLATDEGDANLRASITATRGEVLRKLVALDSVANHPLDVAALAVR